MSWRMTWSQGDAESVRRVSLGTTVRAVNPCVLTCTPKNCDRPQ